MAKVKGLSDSEMAWLIAWNLAAGYWGRVGLKPTEAKTLMLTFVRQLQGNLLEAAKHSRVQLQQALMALAKDNFEEIQGEAPFRSHAQKNLRRLLGAYADTGDKGLTAAWHEIFRDNREVQPARYEPIRVLGGDGESSENAAEVVGAPDQETRVAAEWWYLRYRFGRDWTPGMHMTTTENASGDRFSVHNIELSGGSRKQIFFRLPGRRNETAPHSTQNLRKGEARSPIGSSDARGPDRMEMDIKPVSDYIAKISRLPQPEMVWLLGWNIAAGDWQRIGLNPLAAKELLIDLFGRLQGEVSDLSKRSAERLQQGLMALREGSFEEIQGEPPFSRFAQRNMEALLRAWKDRGEPGFTQVWDATFHANWQDEREHQYPIRIIGETGDCEERALEILGARDRESRAAAEFWYLFYTFGRDWEWIRHETVGEDRIGPQFSVHHIRVAPGSDRRVYFRLSW
jgi:hypothetical protein